MSPVFNQNNLNLYALEFVYLKTTLELFKKFELNYSFLQGSFKSLFKEFEETLETLSKYFNFGQKVIDSDFLKTQMSMIIHSFENALSFQKNLIENLTGDEKKNAQELTRLSLTDICPKIQRTRTLLSSALPPVKECL